MSKAIDIVLENKYFRKTAWCFQHFLTMEFYRKICDKCYWSNIYDPKHSLLFAWKEIIRHWKLLWIVSTENKKRKQGDWMSFSEGIQLLKSHFRYMKKLKFVVKPKKN